LRNQKVETCIEDLKIGQEFMNGVEAIYAEFPEPFDEAILSQRALAHTTSQRSTSKL
jgi:hypothetical protein